MLTGPYALAIFVIGLAVVPLVLIVLSTWRHSKDRQRADELQVRILEQRLHTARLAHEEAKSDQRAWHGSRKFEVIDKVPEAEDACSFYLRHSPVFSRGV